MKNEKFLLFIKEIFYTYIIIVIVEYKKIDKMDKPVV